MKQSVQVEIAGQKLSIRSDEGPAYVQALADYVDGHLRELVPAGRGAFNLQRVALLVAMQIADELFREKDLHQRLRDQVAARLATLRARLDEHETQLRTLEP